MENTQAFIAAVTAGDLDQVRAMLDAQPELVQARTERGNSALLAAIYYGKRAVADLLIERGAPLSLFEAAAAGRTELVRQRLEAEPGLLNACAPDGFQPLGLAAYFGHTDLVDELLARGADPNRPAQNSMRVQALHAAVANEKNPQAALQITRALLAHGAQVNARQEGGWTPLHEAAHHGQAALVHLLLAHGADPALANDHGKRPADLAREQGHSEVAALLEPPGQPPATGGRQLPYEPRGV